MKRMRIISIIALIGLVLLGLEKDLSADLLLTSIGEATVEDFDSFRGDGFSTAATALQLDSATYRATGFSDGDGAFDGNFVTGDFARGDSTGAVTEGGAYAFNVGGGNYAVGVQPTDTDFNPGMFTIRVANDTGTDITGIRLSADGYFYNDEDRSTDWTFQISFDDVNYTTFGQIASLEQADAAPAWEIEQIGGDLPFPFALPHGQQFFIRFRGEDLGGSGDRDQFALARISITPIPEPASAGIIAGGLLAFAMIRRRRKTNRQNQLNHNAPTVDNLAN